MNPVIPERVRDYLYPIITAAAPLLAIYGIIADETVPMWIALGVAVIGNGTAAAYRPSKTLGDDVG